MILTLRPANQEDLAALTDIWLRAEQLEPEPEQKIPTILSHIAITGLLAVAERDGVIAGFASSFVRSGVRFLGQMFIDPETQSSGVGRMLLPVVMPLDGTEMSTIASPDPRAIALYIRHGMIPAWPVYGLTAACSDLPDASPQGVRAIAAFPNDPSLVEMDSAVGGRTRPEDLRYLAEKRGGAPFWFVRGADRIGYGYLQMMRNSPDGRGEDTVRIGPVGVLDAVDMCDCVLAAIGVARELGPRLDLLMPGPNDATRLLLQGGFRISYHDTFMSSTRPPFVDSMRYIPGSGGLY